jgi:succinyl-CoA synthetase beta subunit
MDLLEYQDEQLFARHGVPVPSGAPASTVEQAVAAADDIGYPVELAGDSPSGGGGEPEGETVPPGEGTETEMGAADTRAGAGS